MAEGVKRFEVGSSTLSGGWMREAADGNWVRYPDYEKLEAEQKDDKATTGLAVDRAKRAEAQRDQARQEVLEEVREGLLDDEALRPLASALTSQNFPALDDARRLVEAALATLDPSGEEECERCGGSKRIQDPDQASKTTVSFVPCPDCQPTETRGPGWAQMCRKCAIRRHDLCEGTAKDGGACTCSCRGILILTASDPSV